MKLEPIDTSTTAGKAEVMRLAAEGRKVAYREEDISREWYEAGDPEWDWRTYDYGVIAEPVGPDEVWVTVSEDGAPIDVYQTEAVARRAAATNWQAVRYVRAEG